MESHAASGGRPDGIERENLQLFHVNFLDLAFAPLVCTASLLNLT